MSALQFNKIEKTKFSALVNQHGLPFSAERLSEMSYREYAAIMQSGLNAEQKALIKKIRRRGDFEYFLRI